MLVHEIDILSAPTHPPSLNFCSSSSKAKSEAVQEIRDNTSVDPYSNIPNESMFYLPYGAFVGIFSPCLKQFKGETFHPCLSYLASFCNQ
jgi:hypothetical protein